MYKTVFVEYCKYQRSEVSTMSFRKNPAQQMSLLTVYITSQSVRKSTCKKLGESIFRRRLSMH